MLSVCVLPSVNDKKNGCIGSVGGIAIGMEKLESVKTSCPSAPFSANPIGKSSSVTGRRCSEGSRKLRFPDYVTMAQDGGKDVSLTHRPLLPPRNTPGTHFY